MSEATPQIDANKSSKELQSSWSHSGSGQNFQKIEENSKLTSEEVPFIQNPKFSKEDATVKQVGEKKPSSTGENPDEHKESLDHSIHDHRAETTNQSRKFSSPTSNGRSGQNLEKKVWTPVKPTGQPRHSLNYK